MKPPRRTEALMALPSQRYATPRRGHAGRPGDGPAGMTCADCTHMQIETRGLRRVGKCLVNQRNWTRSSKTDIAGNDPACGVFAAPAPDVGEAAK